MKVLHVVESFSTGVYETVRQIANAAAADGHDVHVAHAVRPWTPPSFRDEFDPRVTFHRLAWDVQRRPAPLGRAAAQLARLLRRERPDVVHLHSTFAGVTGALVRPRGARVVYTPHGYVFLMSSLPPWAIRVARLVERLVARRVTVIGAVSEAEAAAARSLGARRVEVIHNGIAELDREAPADAQGARTGVLAAGRMSAQRQPGAVADIFAGLPAGTSTAWIGDTADEAAAGRFRVLGTRLSGWVSRQTVLEETARARVYLHWTAWDGHPLSVLEAIGAGTVVVAHDIPPVREILGPECVCATVPAAVALITDLLSDDARYARLQREQLAAAQPFSGRRMTGDWLALYARLGGL